MTRPSLRDARAQRRLHVRLLLGAAVGGLLAVPVVIGALLVRGRWGPLVRLDTSVADGLHRYALDHPFYVDVLKVGAVVLDPWVYRAAALVLVVLLIRRGARRLAWWAAVTTVAGGLLGVGLKALVERARPVFDDPVHTSPSWSFPSGHALNSALVTAVILLAVLPALPSRRWRIAAWAVGGLGVLATGYDRIGLGVHYTSDVLAAWFAAAAVVAATAIAFEAWQREEGIEVGPLSSGLDPDDAEKLT